MTLSPLILNTEGYNTLQPSIRFNCTAHFPATSDECTRCSNDGQAYTCCSHVSRCAACLNALMQTVLASLRNNEPTKILPKLMGHEKWEELPCGCQPPLTVAFWGVFPSTTGPKAVNCWRTVQSSITIFCTLQLRSQGIGQPVDPCNTCLKPAEQAYYLLCSKHTRCLPCWVRGITETIIRDVRLTQLKTDTDPKQASFILPTCPLCKQNDVLASLPLTAFFNTQLMQTQIFPATLPDDVANPRPPDEKKSAAALEYFSATQCANNLWLNPEVLISENTLKGVNTVAAYLNTYDLVLQGAPADGNCYFHAFLGSYATFKTRKIPFLDLASDKIAYLRDLIAAGFRASNTVPGMQRAAEIKQAGVWITGSEGELLANALSLDIRTVTVNKDASGVGIIDMLTSPNKMKEPEMWDRIEESEKPKEYILIVDLGGHFVFARPRGSNQSPTTDHQTVQPIESPDFDTLELPSTPADKYAVGDTIRVPLATAFATTTEPWTLVVPFGGTPKIIFRNIDIARAQRLITTNEWTSVTKENKRSWVATPPKLKTVVAVIEEVLSDAENKLCLVCSSTALPQKIIYSYSLNQEISFNPVGRDLEGIPTSFLDNGDMVHLYTQNMPTNLVTGFLWKTSYQGGQLHLRCCRYPVGGIIRCAIIAVQEAVVWAIEPTYGEFVQVQGVAVAVRENALMDVVVQEIALGAVPAGVYYKVPPREEKSVPASSFPKRMNNTFLIARMQ